MKNRKVVKCFGFFLLFMLACTVISRGIYATQIPKISTGKAEEKKISHSIEVYGTVSSGAESALNVKPGLLVSQICVKEGQYIEEGQILMQLDMQKLLEALENAQKDVAVEEAKLKDMKANQQLMADQRSKEKARAGEDLSSASALADASVGAAQQEKDAAFSQLSSYPSWKDYFKNVKEKDAKYKELKQAVKDEVKNAEKEFQSYEKILEESARSEWESGKGALEDAYAQKAAALDEVQKAGESEKQKAKRALEDAGSSGEQGTGTVLEQQNILDAQRKVCEEYQQLLDANGQIKSQSAGFVKRILTEAGGVTAETAVMTLLTEEVEDFEFLAVLSEEQKEYVNIGDKVSILMDGGRNRIEEAPVEAIRKTEDGTYEVTAKIPSLGQTLGQPGKMTINSEGMQYGCCVPLSALFAENQTTYVLVVQEKETILGTELTVRRVDVMVEDKNESHAALSGTPLTAEDKIVTASDKEIVPGKEVRIAEE